MPEVTRGARHGASVGTIVRENGPQASQGAGSAPLVDWDEVRRFLLLIGREGEERLILTVFPPDEGACIHLPGDLGDGHQREVERTLRRHPTHSLGLVVNPALDQPADWGSRPDEQRKDGSPRVWGASSRHISGAVGVWAECDGSLPIEEQELLPARAGLPQPSLTVWSGGKSLHQYWLLGGALLDTESFRSLQQRTAAAIEQTAPDSKPDKGLNNPNRLMRLPGGLHPRTGERCRIHSSGGPLYGQGELERLIPGHPSASASSSSPPPSVRTRSGCDWFDRRTPQQQQEMAVEMLRTVPVRVEPGKGLYGDCFRILAGMVHHFGEAIAIEVCERAGWRSGAWDPASKARSIGPSDQGATIGNLIGAARDHGWRHPLALEEELLLGGFGIEEPARQQHGIGAPAAAPPAPESFADRWAALEAAADDLAASEQPGVRVTAELAERAAELNLSRLSRGDYAALLDQAERRRRPASAPILPGGRFTVRPTVWAVDGLVRHGLNLLVGQPGAGKTRFALACAAAWLKGEESWLSRGVEASLPIEERALLVIGPDQDLTDWTVAMEPLGLVRRLEDGSCELHPRVTLHPMETGILIDADGLATVRRWCDQHPGGMVLADCLAQLLPAGADEDKASAARPVHALGEALGSCWGLLLHHSRKAAGRERNVSIGSARGSSAIEAAVSRVLSLGLIHRKEGGEWIAQEGDDRRELVSTKRGGPTVHLIVRSDASGAWHSEGSADDLRRQERRQAAADNLTELQREVLAALEGEAGERLTARALMGAMGEDWGVDAAAGGKRAAMLRKVLGRLRDLGLVETVLQGKERLYWPTAASSSAASGIDAEPDGGAYESPERLADIREERIPQHIREERDADRIWEAQHRQRTEREEELLEQESAEPVLTLTAPAAIEQPPLPEVGEVVDIADGRGGWISGYKVTTASATEIRLQSLATGKTLTKLPSASRPPWRRAEAAQQTLPVAAA